MLNTPSSSGSISGISQFCAFAELFRLPVSLVAALAGCATTYALNSALPLQLYLLTAGVLFCMTAAACAINDYWDLNKDRINHPNRPLPSGRLSIEQAWWAAVVLFTCALIAAIPLGLYSFILVAVSIVLLWNYSHLLIYSGILGNVLVAAIIAFLILLGSLVAGKPFAMIYPLGFLFCYALARELIWDVHDAKGDRDYGIITVANRWGEQTAFSIAWVLIGVLSASIPVSLIGLPMAHPLLFAAFSSVMLLIFGTTLFPYQQQPSERTYERFVFWERIGMLLGVLGLLGAAPPF
ncbi:ubiquinone biosynthesis protein UbiA [Hydrococcus rivularis NIES-593]|uniref:Ubiquinone biosynthesis protein UbiA n=1 Tax=Hydrococcus rivularis NIES-593 TaxID=1921803 RepID=A0A1U7HHK6_9CYAN|nr:geranylgeranylglycerol-phosphate geranylgeranyltransferase [Hydrococcus rivularis]OKH23018.1 ubiquinone biosynthesis protein UbiA [Hydrococcus rivularis NIES-593]